MNASELETLIENASAMLAAIALRTRRKDTDTGIVTYTLTRADMDSLTDALMLYDGEWDSPSDRGWTGKDGRP